MCRYAKRITKDELQEKLNDKNNFQTIPYKDFNLEIHLQDDADIIIDDIQDNNGLVFSLVSTKTAWDSLPIYFIAYIDEQDRLRAFLPKHGNSYNPWTATHFGSERAWSTLNRPITNMPEEYYEKNEEQGGFQPTQKYKDEFLNMSINKIMMINEFLKFIQVR